MDGALPEIHQYDIYRLLIQAIEAGRKDKLWAPGSARKYYTQEGELFAPGLVG